MNMKQLLEENKGKGYEPPAPEHNLLDEYFQELTADMHKVIEQEFNKPYIKFMPLIAGFIGAMLAFAICIFFNIITH